MSEDPIVIVGMARTPMGAMQGDFNDVAAPLLGAAAIAGALSDGGVASDAVAHGHDSHISPFTFSVEPIAHGIDVQTR